jgi:hypothetical protein
MCEMEEAVESSKHRHLRRPPRIQRGRSGPASPTHTGGQARTGRAAATPAPSAPPRSEIGTGNRCPPLRGWVSGGDAAAVGGPDTELSSDGEPDEAGAAAEIGTRCKRCGRALVQLRERALEPTNAECCSLPCRRSSRSRWARRWREPVSGTATAPGWSTTWKRSRSVLYGAVRRQPQRRGTA